MAHNICALVIEGPYDTALAASLDLRPLLAHGALTVLPIDHHWSAVQAAQRGRTDALDLPEIPFLDELGGVPHEAVIADIVAELTGNAAPRFALIKTEYFGGAGEQCAFAFIGERRITTGLSINEALRALDVVATDGRDELETIGLVHVRHNPGYLGGYAARARALRAGP